jgi:hypothetical protein
MEIAQGVERPLKGQETNQNTGTESKKIHKSSKSFTTPIPVVNNAGLDRSKKKKHPATKGRNQ